MKTASEVGKRVLKEHVGKLNQLVGKIPGLKLVKVVGMEQEILYKHFVKTMTDKVDTVNVKDIEVKSRPVWNEVVRFYRGIMKEPGVRGAARAARELVGFGHYAGSISARIDAAVAEGGTMDELIKKSGATRAKLTAHLRHLKADRGMELATDKDGRITVKKGYNPETKKAEAKPETKKPEAKAKAKPKLAAVAQ